MTYTPEPMIHLIALYSAMKITHPAGILTPDTIEPYVSITELSKYIASNKDAQFAAVDFINNQFEIDVPYGRPIRDYWENIAEEVKVRLFEKTDILEG